MVCVFILGYPDRYTGPVFLLIKIINDRFIQNDFWLDIDIGIIFKVSAMGYDL